MSHLSIEPWPLARRPFAQSIEIYKAMSLEQILETLQISDDTSTIPPLDVLPLLPTLIVANPKQFVAQADHFQGQSPEVVCAALRGFSQLLRTPRHLDWSHLIALCAWTVEQRFPLTREEPAPQIVWAEASKEVAALLLSAFQKQRDTLPLVWRETLWSMLESLAEDGYGLIRNRLHEEPQPYWSIAINSTRGLALQEVIAYACWLWQNWQATSSHQEAYPEIWTFERASEARALIERFLAPDQDDSGVAHAVFGYYFSLLLTLDTPWTAEHLPDLFPHRERHPSLSEAAWETYLWRKPLSNKVFVALRGEYLSAINRLVLQL